MNFRAMIIRAIYFILPLFIFLIFESIRTFFVGMISGALIFSLEILLLIVPLNYLLNRKKNKMVYLFTGISLLRWGIFGFLIYYSFKILDISPQGVIIGILYSSVVFLSLLVYGSLQKE